MGVLARAAGDSVEDLDDRVVPLRDPARVYDWGTQTTTELLTLLTGPAKVTVAY